MPDLSGSTAGGHGDLYVQIDGSDKEELEVTGIYAPELENGERLEE